MGSWKIVQRPVVALSLGVCLATGCSNQGRAIDDAKKDVALNGQPEEVIYVDRSGNTTVTMVSAAAPGSTTPTLTQSVTPAGVTTMSGLPDWSNGQHPMASHVARYRAPGVLAAPAAPAEPGAATATNTPVYAPASAAALPSAGAANGASAARFVPTDVTIASGTGLAIRINQRIDVKHARRGERFTGELAESVTRDGNVLLPRGTHVRGVIDASHRRGHFKGRSILELRLTSLDLDGKSYDLETADFVASRKGKGKRSAGFIAGTAGVGMLVGGIASGGVGLAVGGLAGGGLGTLLAGVTGNRDIVIPAESLVRFRLEDDLTVQPSSDVQATVAQR